MRLVWVPQWTVLPVIVEDRAMGDEHYQRSQLPSHGPANETSVDTLRLNDTSPFRESSIHSSSNQLAHMIFDRTCQRQCLATIPDVQCKLSATSIE